MNIQVTNQEKYNTVIKVWNYGAKLISKERVDGHLSIISLEDNKEWTTAKFGVTCNSDLESEYGFKFVSDELNIDNNKYYF